MARKASNPYIRTTEVGSFVNASWKDYWYRSIENGSKSSNTPGLVETAAQELVTLTKGAQSYEFFKEFLSQRTALAEAARISRESTDFGKAVHSIAEAFLLGQPAPTEIKLEDQYKKSYMRPITEREKVCGGYLVQWCNEAKVKPLIIGGKPAIELPLENEELGVTGHPDLVCTFGDDTLPWLVDWKTSKECRDEYGLQLGAYAISIKKQYDIEVNNGVIVRVPSDPNVFPQFEAHQIFNLLSYHGEVFKNALDVVKYFKHKGRHMKVKKLKEAA